MRTPVPTGKDGRKDLLLSKDGVHKHFRVATLVLLAFAGPRPPGMEACHANGDASDDRLENLRWDTSSANKFDTVRHGNHHMTKHVECPRKHPLVKPNLAPGRLREGHRVCRACTWARAACQRAQKRGEPYDLDAEAAVAFDRIMSFAVPGSDSESEDRLVVS